MVQLCASVSAGGTGERICADALPWRLHTRGSGNEDQPDGGTSTGQWVKNISLSRPSLFVCSLALSLSL